MNHLAELAERDAVGEVAELYADIRAVLGTSFVNLVYRHLATEPEQLAWAWRAVRPHMVDGALAAQATRLGDAVGRQIDAWTLPPADRLQHHEDVGRLVGMYNQANTLNLLAMTHLLSVGPSRKTAPTAAAGPAAARPVASAPAAGSRALPGVPAMDALTDAQRASVARLNRLGEDTEPTIIASLYRHLAAWPDGLSFAEAVLAPLDERGLLAGARVAAFAAARELVHEEPLPMPPAPAAFVDRFGATLGQLAGTTISKMLPIGQLLQAALSRAS
ncbi:MAG: hypothetical protein R3E68_01965 [Burkholderiaceae bacterium]